MRQLRALLNREQGQTLIWVAAGMVVLMIMLALAVDVGTLQGERRNMQNAADAAALEAARARCFDPGVTTGAQAAAIGQQFAVSHYSNRPLAASEAFTVTARLGNDWEFEAYATELVNLSFAGIFSNGQTPVTAHAAAACGGSPQACGLFPLAFKQSIWNPISSMCGQKFYVWTTELDQDNPSGQPTPIPPNCTDRCDCTKVYTVPQGNLIPGVIAVADTGRAWLDFTSAGSPLNPTDCGGNNGCGANELRCWIQNDSQVLALKNTCVSGTSGIKMGVRQDINDREGDYVTIPIFDARCNAGSGQGVCDADGFNIVDFGCVRVEHWDANERVNIAWAANVTPTPDPAQPNKPPDTYCTDKPMKMMAVTVGCGQCETTCGKASQGGNPGSGIKAVSLIE